MSSDSDDDVILYYYYRRRRRRQRRFWVHPYIEKNINCRLFVAAKELQHSDSKFRALYRMSKDSYLELVRIVSPGIQQRNTNMRECVSPEERILITLRYLATGSTFVALSLYFARGDNTVSRIVAETTEIMWNILQGMYMNIPNREQWKTIAGRFYSLWGLPNCIGAIDGKHIRIEKFPNTGSQNFNYKHYHSVVLMACCDANGLFTFIETGYAGRNSDGGIFRASAIKHWITNEGLDIPPPSRLPDDEKNNDFPYYFVGDEAFPLSRYLMRPYPQRGLDNTKRIFNYRLSRGRKIVECTFGMMAEKFQVLNTPIRCRNPETVNHIVKAACVLHNYVRQREGVGYTPMHFEKNQGLPVNNAIPQLQDIEITDHSSGYVLRNYLANHFLTPRASLPWQWNYIV